MFATKHAAWALAVCYGSMMCLAISANLAPVYLTTFRDAFGGASPLTEEQLGRIPAVIFAATVAGILLGGPLADRTGGKAFVMLGLAFTVGGLSMLASATHYALLLGAGAVMGLGGGILDMVLSPIVCAVQPHQRTRALNWLHAFYCVGALATVLVASVALKFGIGWRAVVWSMNALPVAMFLGFVPLQIPALVHEEATRTPVLRLLSRPAFLTALIAITLCGATEQGMSQWLPAYAETSLGYSKSTGALALAGFSIGMAAGRLVAGNVAHYVKPLPMMVWSCVGCVACYSIGCFAPWPSVALSACVVMGLAVSCLWPNSLSLMADRFPHGGASMFSLMTAGGNIGCVAMPWAIGLLAQHRSIRVGLASAILCPVLLLLILLANGYQRSGMMATGKE